LWKPDDAAHQAEISIRLGWLDVADEMLERLSDMTTFAGEVKRAGFTHALLCGMGGSSLAPEVLRETFGVAKGYLNLAVLDSTDPAAVSSAAERSDPARTLYIVSSKSGGTAEINAMFKFFWDRVSRVKGNRAGENFIAITDPGTSLEALARERGFRRTFINPPEIGGRYSALSFFGLVPAALLGMDVAKLLARAKEMMHAASGNIPATRNGALRLGAALGVLAEQGRDKVTFITAESIRTFGYWVEQLIAESTGKENKGILPVEGEAVAAPKMYGNDRVFVHLKLGAKDKYDKAVKALEQAGHPVIEIVLDDEYDLGGEFLRWEIATAVASWVLGINPFDQPNVQEAKEIAKRYLNEIAQSGRLADTSPILQLSAPDFAARFRKYLSLARPGDYVSLQAYIARTAKREALLRELQSAIRDATKAATTLGYGPRFLHSTGQLHKGGANNGLFIQFVCDDAEDTPVPGEPYTFNQLKGAQALGDYGALLARKRRVIRITLGNALERGLQKVRDVLKTRAKSRKK
jgi:glucose-6-phosphate isomerase